MKGIRIEAWEARGLFQLLDTDALGQVSIEDFLHGLVRLKCKDQGVDLTTVMYENKRILTRLLAFMRFAEDHFRDMESFLGMTSPGASGRDAAALETYLLDAANCLSKSLSGFGHLSEDLGRLGHCSDEIRRFTRSTDK
uniref:EF-hand domain-containing protein n=1 Tax=Alexandrium catenella TaxID=2925 RepID=A0A7S1MSK3_ALECA